MKTPGEYSCSKFKDIFQHFGRYDGKLFRGRIPIGSARIGLEYHYKYYLKPRKLSVEISRYSKIVFRMFSCFLLTDLNGLTFTRTARLRISWKLF